MGFEPTACTGAKCRTSACASRPYTPPPHYAGGVIQLIGEAGIEPAFWRTHRPAPMGDVLARLSRRESEVKAAFQDPDGMPRIMPRGSEALSRSALRCLRLRSQCNFGIIFFR